MIKRKDFWLYICIGLMVLLFGFVAIYIFNKKYPDSNPLPIFLIIIVVMLISNFLKCKKCKCPHCGAGGHFFEGSHYWYDLGWANKNVFICPDCKKEIKII